MTLGGFWGGTKKNNYIHIYIFICISKNMFQGTAGRFCEPAPATCAVSTLSLQLERGGVVAPSGLGYFVLCSCFCYLELVFVTGILFARSRANDDLNHQKTQQH